MEVFDFDMDKAALIGPAPLAARFAADMRTTHANFGLLVDLSHFPTTYETSRFVIRTLRPYITHFHFGNAVVEKGCDGYGDLHPRMGYPHSANDVAEQMCIRDSQITDRLTVLRDGREVLVCEKEELDANEVVSAMIGRKLKANDSALSLIHI